MDTETVRVRFAPSPTGMVHVGNARTALYNWLFARRMGGQFLLRIEDTDLERSEARYETQLLEDLRWLGLDWDEGPESTLFRETGSEGPSAPYRQSERLEIYARHTEQLLEEGKAYRCFCTAEELDAERAAAVKEHRPQVYGGRCRGLGRTEIAAKLAAGEPFAVRLEIGPEPLRFKDMVRGAVEFAAETVSDPILVRSASGVSAGVPVYNYVVTVDDALMGITHVIRGDDHLSNTPKQVAIYQAFGWKVPVFAHLSTILGEDRERLSKRHGATSIASFREMGYLPEALANYLALLGWGAEDGKTETFTLDELAKIFTLERVTPSPAVFSFDKLNWLNRHYLKLAAPERVLELSWRYFADKLGEREAASEALTEWFGRVVALLTPSVDHLDQLPAKAGLLLGYDAEAARGNAENAEALGAESARVVLAEFADRVRAHAGPVRPEDFKGWMNDVKAATGVKGKELFHPVRIALTGAHSGPEFDKVIPLIEDGAALGLGILDVRERLAAFVGA